MENIFQVIATYMWYFLNLSAQAHIMCVVSFQAFSAMGQLRTHCAAKISALEESVESQQELLAALKKTYPEQVQRRG